MRPEITERKPTGRKSASMRGSKNRSNTMYSKTNRSRIHRLLGSASALAIMGVLAMPTAADASTAANTAITNTATVNFTDVGNTAQTPVTAFATVQVLLKVATATVTGPTPGAQTIPQGAGASETYTIYGNANGPDTYYITHQHGAGWNVNVSNPVSGVTITPSTIVLGGTTVAATTAAGTTIQVPYSTSGSYPISATAINGITCSQAGPPVVKSYIEIAGTQYLLAQGNCVTGITPPSYPPNGSQNIATLNLDASTPIAAGVAAGTIIGGVASFTWAFTQSGQVTTGNTTGSYNVTVLATGSSEGSAPNYTLTADAGTPASNGPVVITINQPELHVTKLVCDITVSSSCTPTASTINSLPGHTLLYMLTVTNISATSALNVKYSDIVPEYLTYTANSAAYSATSGTAYGSATSMLDSSTATTGYSASALPAISWNPAAGSGTASVATVASGGTLIFFYEASVN